MWMHWNLSKAWKTVCQTSKDLQVLIAFPGHRATDTDQPAKCLLKNILKVWHLHNRVLGGIMYYSHIITSRLLKTYIWLSENEMISKRSNPIFSSPHSHLQRISDKGAAVVHGNCIFVMIFLWRNVGRKYYIHQLHSCCGVWSVSRLEHSFSRSTWTRNSTNSDVSKF